MSEIESLVSQFEDMCGESGTELGNAALGERNELRQAVKALLMVVEAHTSEYTQHHYLETISFAKHVLSKYESGRTLLAPDGLKAGQKCLCPSDGIYPGCPVHGSRRR